MNTKCKAVAICVFMFSMILSGCGPGQIFGPTVTPMPTFTSIPTRTPTPTRTHVPTPKPRSPQRERQADGMVEVYIPDGEFQMGTWSSESKDEMPMHSVYLDAFWIDLTEVTNGMYEKCILAGMCGARGYPGDLKFSEERMPAAGVFWNDALAYCQWVGARLPTEAEWEKAARGTRGIIYPWGNVPTWGYKKWNDHKGNIFPVGYIGTDISPYGVLDMGGNVTEWVADWYDSEYYDRSPSRNPTGPSSGEDRVIRGGSWLYDDWYVASAERSAFPPDLTLGDVGFRCAASP